MRLGIFYFALTALPLAGQITLDRTNIPAVTWVNKFADAPFPQKISIIGSGSLAFGGCTGSGCGAFTWNFCTVGSQPCVATTTAPADLYVSFNGGTIQSFSAGTYTTSAPLTSSAGTCNGISACTITTSLVMVNRNVPTVATPGTETGCVNTSSFFADNDKCTITPAALPGANPLPTLLGSSNSYTDGNFGGTVWMTSAPTIQRHLAADGIVTPFNADNSLIFNSSPTPPYGFFATFAQTGIDAYSNLVQATSIMPDPNNPNVYYTNSGVTILKNTLSGGTVTSTVVYTYPGSATSIDTGGDAQITADGWSCFYTVGSDHLFGLINLYNPAQVYLTPAISGSKTFRTCNVSQTNTPNGKRYLMCGYLNFGIDLYTLATGGGALVSAGTMPKQMNAAAAGYFANGSVCDSAANAANWCVQVGHSPLHSVNGVQYFVYQMGSSNPFSYWYAWLRLDTGDLMTIPYEAGGGMYVPGFPLAGPTTSNAFDEHAGCADQPVCVVSLDNDPPLTCGSSLCYGTPYSLSIVGISNTSPGVVSYSESDTIIANGDTVYINGVRGAVAANGLCTVGTLNTIAKTFSCTGTNWTSTGTYTAGYGGAISRAVPTNIGMPHQTSVLMFDATNIASNTWKVTKLFNSLSFSVRGSGAGGSALYYGQAQCAISRDGALVACGTNNLLPDGFRTMVAPTGYVPVTARTMVTNSSVSKTVLQ